MKHYDQSQLVELYYLPHEAVDIRGHVDACADCAARWNALRTALEDDARSAERAVQARPEASWTWQRAAIARKIRESQAPRVNRWLLPKLAAIAAVTTLIVGSSITFRLSDSAGYVLQPVPTATASARPAAAQPAAQSSVDVLASMQASDDPWKSDELADYQPMVNWESWVEEENPSPHGGAA